MGGIKLLLLRRVVEVNADKIPNSHFTAMIACCSMTSLGRALIYTHLQRCLMFQPPVIVTFPLRSKCVPASPQMLQFSCVRPLEFFRPPHKLADQVTKGENARERKEIHEQKGRSQGRGDYVWKQTNNQINQELSSALVCSLDSAFDQCSLIVRIGAGRGATPERNTVGLNPEQTRRVAEHAGS